MEIGPFAFAAMVAQFAGGVETTGLAFTHDCWVGGGGVLVSFGRFGDCWIGGKRERWYEKGTHRLFGGR